MCSTCRTQRSTDTPRSSPNQTVSILVGFVSLVFGLINVQPARNLSLGWLRAIGGGTSRRALRFPSLLPKGRTADFGLLPGQPPASRWCLRRRLWIDRTHPDTTPDADTSDRLSAHTCACLPPGSPSPSPFRGFSARCSDRGADGHGICSDQSVGLIDEVVGGNEGSAFESTKCNVFSFLAPQLAQRGHRLLSMRKKQTCQNPVKREGSSQNQAS